MYHAVSDICQNYSRIAIGTAHGQDARLIRLRCKQWSCDHCADINKRQWQKKLIEGIKSLGGQWSFWTLTHDLDVARHDLLAQRKYLSACWNRLMTKLRRARGEKFAYVRVLEIGSSGTNRMHMHVLINWRVDDARKVVRADGSEYWTSDTYRPMLLDARFGFIHDTRNITDLVADRPDDEQAIYTASYVSKYMSKQHNLQPYPRSTRRFSVSRNWPELAHDDEFADNLTWDVRSQLSLDYAIDLWMQRKRIYDIDADTEIVMSDFGGQDDLWIDRLRYQIVP